MDKQQIKTLAEYFDSVGNYQKAIYFYENLLPTNDFIIYGNLSRLYGLYYGFEQKEKQLEYAKIAYKLNPQNDINILNCFLLYCKFNMFNEAKELWPTVEKIDSSSYILHSYGWLLVNNKEFKEGWLLHHFGTYEESKYFPNGNTKYWEPNTDIKDKTLLVYCDQGLGDTILFIRFIKDLIPLCKHVKILVQEELYDIFKLNFDYDFYTKLDGIEYDYNIPLMSLPTLLGIEVKDVKPEPYLDVKTIKQEHTEFRIGIGFEGTSMGEECCRDIPLTEFLPLWNIPNTVIYNLQKTDNHNQLQDFPKDIINIGQTFNSFIDTARVMKQMDLIITTDNVLLNLAGALGVPTFGLFNKYVEFRWYDLPESVGWYNIKPFQCKELNEWTPVIQNVVKQIEQIKA